MPRSSRSGGGRSAPAGARGTHTMASSRPQQQQPAHYQQQQHAPTAHQQQQQARSPGLFGQMASTAAGVAVGSTVGHGLSNMLFGGGGGATQPAEQPSTLPGQWSEGAGSNQASAGGMSCEVQSKDFLRCLDATGNNMDSCAFYLDQLKACQAAARQYA